MGCCGMSLQLPGIIIPPRVIAYCTSIGRVPHGHIFLSKTAELITATGADQWTKDEFVWRKECGGRADKIGVHAMLDPNWDV